MECVRVDPDDAAQVAAFVALRNDVAAVDDPDPWPTNPEIVVGGMRYGYDLHPEGYYLCTTEPGGPPVAAMVLELPDRDNVHLVWSQIIVHPEQRRRGYGTQLLAEVMRRAREAGRTHVWVEARADDAGAAAFAARFGFVPGSQDARRRQVLAEVDEQVVEGLYKQALTASQDYELSRLQPPTEDHVLSELSAVTEAINDAPMGTLEFEDEIYDLPRLRDMETARAGRGERVFRVIARHRGSGEVAGHTYLVLHPSEAKFAHQCDTAVSRDHRGHRLGMLLKIEAMRWLAEAEPQISTIETWNNVDNTFMIKVNEALGYELSFTGITYQLRF